MPHRLLVLSNGHGEDLIAQRVISALHRHAPDLEIHVLPLVGEGNAFSGSEQGGILRRIGPTRTLPSGGFSNQSLRGLLQDLVAGLPGLSWRQLRLVRHWSAQGGAVLAVGDLLPLLMAWAGGGPYGFIGTPKSDYTWRSPPPAGWPNTPLADAYHRVKGSEWDPWEWALMARPRCRLVAVRDPLTARGLRRHGVEAVSLGNPMMDGFQRQEVPDWLKGRIPVLLLPGSRMPEALTNGRGLLRGLVACLDEAAAVSVARSPVTVLVPTGSRPDASEMAPLLRAEGFSTSSPPPDSHAVAGWRRGSTDLLLGPGCFGSWAPWALIGLATAGTATEQLVGLGVPALSLPGPGPQFTSGFARRQSRLLAGAVEPCRSARDLGARMGRLLEQTALRVELGRRGPARMGPPGGSERLAAVIASRLLAGHGDTAAEPEAEAG